MSRKQKLTGRYVASDSERWRIALLAEYGFYYKTIAKRIYGHGDSKYVPSNTEVSRVGAIARQEGVSVKAWRNGESKNSQHILRGLSSNSITKAPRLRILSA